MKKFLIAAVAVTSIASQNAQAADTWPYWYLGLSGGVAIQNDSDWENAATATSGSIESDSGYVFNASLGYRPHNTGTLLDSSRIEIEGSYRKQDFEAQPGGLDGNYKTTAVAVNYLYDFAPGAGINPYIGAGLGYAHFDLEDNAALEGGTAEWIYQVMAGVGFSFEELPQTEWTLGYRYFAPFSDPSVNVAGPGRLEYEFDNHTVEAGARFRF